MKTFIENNILNFRHWITNHESLLLGGSLGFFHSGPIGLVIGAWLGNYISEKVYATTRQVHHATQMVQPIVAPISFARNKLQSLWQLTKSGYQASKNWFSNEEQLTAIQPQDSHKVDKGQPKQDNQKAVQTSHPSLLQRAADLFDLINGQVDEPSFDLINGQVDEPSQDSHNADKGQPKPIKDSHDADKGQPKPIKDIHNADKGQPKPIKDSHNADKGQPKPIKDSQEIMQPRQRSLTQTAADVLDMMNGYADEETVEEYQDSWLARDISTIPSLVINQFRGLTQRFWSQPTVNSTTTSEVNNTVRTRATLN